VPIRLESSFERALVRLPPDIQIIARHAVQNPSDPQYRPFKKLAPGRRLRRNSWSIRITRNDYRAICERNGGDISWYWIGDHADFDKFAG